MDGRRPLLAPLAALLVILAGPLAATAADSTLDTEAAVMLGLREALWSNWGRSMDGVGWNIADLSHHCSWNHVDCDDQQRVTMLVLKLNLEVGHTVEAAVHSGLVAAVQALSSLHWLTYLDMNYIASTPLPAAVLEAWVQPGAFPRLQSLILRSDFMSNGSLPDILPAALPSLELWTMDLAGLQSTLPASWGASPVALPALQALNLRLQIQGRLPPQWGLGFSQLRILKLRHVPPEEVPGYESLAPAPAARSAGAASGSSAAAGLPAPGSDAGLPVEWASGFPELERLSLYDLQLGGQLPDEWIGGFPHLIFLALDGLSLTGSIPAAIFHHHTELTSLWLENNRFTGTLPAEWAQKGMSAVSVSGNQLTGPAFPPSWLQQGALGALLVLSLSGNARLTGTLPASLPWPYLNSLYVSNTGLTGSIPAAWCKAPFAKLLSNMDVTGTRVDPVLPPCAAHDLPLLFNHSSWSLPASLATSLTITAPQTGTSALPASLAVLLPGAALLTAGWLVRQRQLRRGRYLAVQKSPPGTEMEELLRPASWRSDTTASSTAELAARGTAGRRARLTSLLTSRASQGVRMVPLAPLPAIPAHHLPLRQGSAADSGVGVSEASSAAPGVAGAGLAGSTLQQLQLQLAGSNVSTAGASGMPGRSVCEDAQWGLETFSLQLQDGMLEFVTDSRGQLTVLGEGGHAVVYLARLRGIAVAVKVFELQPGTDSRAMWREAAILRNCKHERIMALHGVAVSGQLVMLAMQLMQGGCVHSALQDLPTRKRLRWRDGGRQVAMDVAEGLHYLHTTLGVMHSDIKSGNVLLTLDLRACLGDMSVAKAVGSQARSAAGFCCTHGAPEQLLGFQCTLAADMYGFGVLLIELTTQQTVQRRGDWRLPRVPDDCSQAVLALIEDCMQQDPQRRCTAGEALQRLRAEVGAGL